MRKYVVKPKRSVIINLKTLIKRGKNPFRGNNPSIHSLSLLSLISLANFSTIFQCLLRSEFNLNIIRRKINEITKANP